MFSSDGAVQYARQARATADSSLPLPPPRCTRLTRPACVRAVTRAERRRRCRHSLSTALHLSGSPVLHPDSSSTLSRCRLRLLQRLMEHNDPQQCAKDLVDRALSLGSTDNVTAVRASTCIHAPLPCVSLVAPGGVTSIGKDEILHVRMTRPLLGLLDYCNYTQVSDPPASRLPRAPFPPFPLLPRTAPPNLFLIPSSPAPPPPPSADRRLPARGPAPAAPNRPE